MSKSEGVKIKLTPKGVAGMYLLIHCKCAGPDNLQVLTNLLEELATQGFKHGLMAAIQLYDARDIDAVRKAVDNPPLLDFD